MDTECADFLKELPGEIKEYFFITGTYPLESYFAPLPDGKWALDGLYPEHNRREKEHEQSKLIAQLGGKRPPQVARTVLLEYFEIFSSCTLNKVEQLRKLFFKNRTTWDNIDAKLKAAARICHHQRSELQYWDMTRFAVRCCKNETKSIIKRDKEVTRRAKVNKSPRQIQEWVKRQNILEENRSEQQETEKFYTYSDGKAYVTFRGQKYGLNDEKYEVPNDGSLYISGMSVCRYCWRAAFKQFGEQWAYCHNHKNPKEISRPHIKYANIIRPHDNWLASKAFMDIWQDFMPINIIRVLKTSNGNNDITHVTLKEVWNYGPQIIIKQLPNVLLLLNSRGVDTRIAEQIVKGLEFPPPKLDESPNEARIRKMQYEDFVFDYGIYAPHLVWAESWLKYEAERPTRGGERKGAGRPRQRPLEIPSET